MEQKDLRLPRELALALVEYLAGKPWKEVNRLLAALHKLEELPGEGEG